MPDLIAAVPSQQRDIIRHGKVVDALATYQTAVRGAKWLKLRLYYYQP